MATTSFRNRGQDQGSGCRQASSHDTDSFLLGDLTVQTQLMPQKDLHDQMTGARQNLQDLCILRGIGGLPHTVFNCGDPSEVADLASAHRTIPGIKLWWGLHVGSWNILSFSEEHPLPLLSNELSKLRVDIVGLSEIRRLGSDETSSKGFTYYLSSMSNGHHVKEVTTGISSRLQPSTVEIIPVDKRILRLRLKHGLEFMFIVAVYAPTKMCKTEEKMFYIKLDSVLYHCPCCAAHIVLGYFNSITDTKRAGYKLCVDPYGSHRMVYIWNGLNKELVCMCNSNFKIKLDNYLRYIQRWDNTNLPNSPHV